MPAQQSRGRDQKDRPAISRQQLRQSREDHPVRRAIPGPGHLPAQHRELVAQYHDLHVLRVRRGTQPDQPEHLPDDHEHQSAHHYRLILPGSRPAWSHP
jgi:hypothetical protein